MPLFWRVSVSLKLPPALASTDHLSGDVRRAIEGALRSARGNGVRFRRRWSCLSWHEPWFPLTEEELTYVLPGPADDPPVPSRATHEGGPILPLGRSDSGCVVGPVVEPNQGRHVAVLGETGMGKSATLIAVARKAAAYGGVVLFDPLGETAEGFVDGLESNARRDRLLWVSPERGGAEINALEGIGDRSGDPVLSDRRLTDLVHALRRVRSGRYDSKYWGPRLEEMLTRALNAAAAFPSGTLVDAHTLLATGGRTRRVVPSEAQDAVRELADRVRERPEDAEGARRLLYEVVRSPVLRRMLCEPEPRLHASELVAPGRIAVVSGDASKVGESTARYLLAVYLALVWSELLARSPRSKTFVILDESQWFSHESLAEMLRLARRRNVHVVLATQTIGSLPEGVDAAVWTNVSDFVAFRGSPEEAREFARATSGVSVEDLLALPRGHAAVLLGKGNTVAWVRTVGRPPAAPREWGDEECVPMTSAESPAPGSSSVDPPSATVESVLAWIRSRALLLSPEESLRVDLAELRKSVDPAGRAVREAGAILGRAGAIRSSVRAPAGSAWILDPARIPSAPPVPAGLPDPGDAEGPQPS